MRRIDVDKVLAEFPVRRNHHDEKHGNMHFINGIETVMEYLDEIAEVFAIDAEPVRHGKWEHPTKSIIARYCSLCGARHVSGSANNFCPNCGTKMDKM